MKRFTVKRALFAIGIILVVWFVLSNYLYYRSLFAPTPEGAFHKLATVHTGLVTRKVTFIDRVLGFIQSVTNSAPSSASSSPSLRVPEDEELAGLDKKYGHLSEYWEMRPESKGIARLECLKKAHELNPDVPDVVFFLAREELKALGDAWNQGSPWKAEWDEMEMNGAKDALELELDNGAWHFLIAVEQNSLGMWDESIEEMKLAVDAPEFRMPRLYPARRFDSLLLDLYRNPKIGVPGTSFLAISQAGVNFMDIKDVYKQVQVGVNLSGDVEVLTVFHRAAVRMAGSPDSDWLDRIVAKVLIGVLARTYIDLLEDGKNTPEALAVRVLLERTEGYTRTTKLLQYHYSFPLAMGVEIEASGDDMSFLDNVTDSLSVNELQRQFVALDYVKRQADRDLASKIFEPLLVFDYADPVGSLEAIKEREAEIAERERAESK